MGPGQRPRLFRGFGCWSHPWASIITAPPNNDPTLPICLTQSSLATDSGYGTLGLCIINLDDHRVCLASSIDLIDKTIWYSRIKK